MLISMTGFGSASFDEQGTSCAVELRSVNNRFFKAVIKLPDRLATLEPEIDRVLRESLVRGSIVLVVSVKDHLVPAAVMINEGVLKTYVDQLEALLKTDLGRKSGVGVDLAHVLSLPGVVEAGEDSVEYVRKHQPDAA